MKKSFKCILFVIAALSITTCKTPYNPTPVATISNYLVVEGLINISDSTYIKLSRTVNLTSSKTLKPELNAIVTIESNKGVSYALAELGNGTYAAPPLSLSSANQYRIRIKTSNGGQYVSNFGDTKVTPPIDSIGFKATTDLKIYVNTHDPNNATRYYRWDFTEEWEFHPAFNSSFISDGLKILIRTQAQQIWDCYRGDVSSSITLGSSIQLSQDVINQVVVNTIAPSEEKIAVKYSILVKQYALTQDAYNYWTLLKKNTEQLGSIFDAQPSASIGNIQCLTNPAEPVIGYISTGTITYKRIFITKNQLPNWFTTSAYPSCQTDSIFVHTSPRVPHPILDEYVNYKNAQFAGNALLQIPISQFLSGKDTCYISAEPICVDCTLRGIKIPPAYWK
jgi:hypothetical protein